MDTTKLDSISQLKAMILASKDIPVYLFKHSTRCPISHAAHDEYLKFVGELEENSVVCADLDLLEHRDVSAAIADETGVEHQSPQAILLVGGKVQWSATHGAITAASLQTAYSEI